jgi:thiamine-phosphate pyrophosphorylase
VDTRRQRLEQARLYLVCDAQPDQFLHAVLRGGVDLVQLRMKDAEDREVILTGRRFREICAEHEALLILNDRPDLVSELDADGVHVGQDDVAVAAAREVVGEERLVGLSTHSPEQVDSAQGADYIGVGPVFETPTKPGRPAVGPQLVRYAFAHAPVPFFAIGGISPTNLASIREAGATRVAVVRALTQAQAPELVARALKQALAGGLPEEARLGAA